MINAAGPFSLTARALASAALEARCHYVDINGELDVYRNIDDLAPKADQREVAIVSGAGVSAAASDVILDRALAVLQQPGGKPLRAVRNRGKAEREFHPRQRGVRRALCARSGRRRALRSPAQESQTRIADASVPRAGRKA